MILTAGHSVSARESSYVLDAARYGWNRQWGDYIKKFEKSFAEYVGTKYALSTSSCTGALHLVLTALKIGPGDEVIVPDVTWVQTASPVVYVGATPVFADIKPDSWCLSPESFEKAIAEQTGPCYLRLGKTGEPIVHKTAPDWQIGKAINLHEGKDVTLIVTGGMLYNKM